MMTDASRSGTDPACIHPSQWPEGRFSFLVVDSFMAPRILAGYTLLLGALTDPLAQPGDEVLVGLHDGSMMVRKLLASNGVDLVFGDGQDRITERLHVSQCFTRIVLGVFYRCELADPKHKAQAERLRCERLAAAGVYPMPDIQLLKLDPLEPRAAQQIEELQRGLRLH